MQLLIKKKINETDDEKQKLYCVYVTIGQKRSTVRQTEKTLQEMKLLTKPMPGKLKKLKPLKPYRKKSKK